jgi:hypothetical protein
MRLAAMLHCTVGELGTRMDSSEFADWLAFEQEFGLPDAYFVVARLAAVIEGAMTGKARSAADYVPYFRPHSPAHWPLQTVAEQRAIVRAHIEASRAKSSRNGRSDRS